MNKKSSNSMLIIIMTFAIFAAYSIILFAATGFAGHDITYWFSFAFMFIAFCLFATIGFILNRSGGVFRDWFFNYPIMKHGVIYVAVEIVASVTFIILSVLLKATINIFAIAIAVQLLILIIYLVFLVSAFQLKRISKEVRADIANSVSAIKTIRAIANSNVAYANNEHLKKVCSDFADQLKFSDPVSCRQSKEYEENLLNGVNEVKQLITNDKVDEAIARIQQLSKLLGERNEIIKTKAEE